MPRKQAGGTIASDLSKLAVPFGLVLLKQSLENFLKKEKARTTVPRPSAARRTRNTNTFNANANANRANRATRVMSGGSSGSGCNSCKKVKTTR